MSLCVCVYVCVCVCVCVPRYYQVFELSSLILTMKPTGKRMFDKRKKKNGDCIVVDTIVAFHFLRSTFIF